MQKLLVLLLIAFAINATARISAGKEVVSTFVGTAILGIFCAITGALWRWDIIYAFVTLFLVSSLLLNGQGLLGFLAKLLNGTKAK